MNGHFLNLIRKNVFHCPDFHLFIKQGGKMKKEVKEWLDVLEDIMTIIVSLMAIWGTIIAYEKGFWHALHGVVTHYHEKILADEQKIEQDAAKDASKLDSIKIKP